MACARPENFEENMGKIMRKTVKTFKGFLSPSPSSIWPILRHAQLTGRSREVLLNNLAEQQSRVAIKGDLALRESVTLLICTDLRG